MTDGYFLDRAEIAKFIPDVRAQRRFDLMQKSVVETGAAITSNIEGTQTLRDATYITLSPNAELPNERVFRWGAGLRLTVDDSFATLTLSTDVPRSSGGYTLTFVGEGDSSVALPLEGRLATVANPETLENKTLSAPVLDEPRLTGIGDYADDVAADAAGVPVGGVYHTTGTLKVRLV